MSEKNIVETLKDEEVIEEIVMEVVENKDKIKKGIIAGASVLGVGLIIFGLKVLYKSE